MADDPPPPPTRRLGDLLYSRCKAPMPEKAWSDLVRAIAERDQAALHALYRMAHRIVFTLMLRMTANRLIAEELTVDVFHDIWRRAPQYDPASGSVLGWIMNQARSRAIDRLRYESRRKRNAPDDWQPEQEPVADPGDKLAFDEQRRSLQAAIGTLTPDERLAIETTFFGGCTHAEAAVRLKQPLGTVKTRIRSGLHKLRQVLAAEQETP